MKSNIPTVIRVGPKPEAFTEFGTYFDGVSAVPQNVVLTVDDARGALRIHVGEQVILWPLNDVRKLRDQAKGDLIILRSKDDPVARVTVTDPLILARCPNLNRRTSDVSPRRLIAWAASALAAVALIITVLIPTMADQLADYMPIEGQKALGETTYHQIRQALAPEDSDLVGQCSSPAGTAALDKIRARLEGATSSNLPLTVAVLDHEMVNAFALPGGFVVFFRGLLETAESPEELAAVFAHEIGHVEYRHVTRHVLRSAGSIGVLGLLFGDFAGGALVLFLTEQLIEAQYSRTAEEDADAFGHQMLIDAGVSPEANAQLFEAFLDISGEASGLAAHLGSHPAMQERIDAARAAVPEGFVTRPLLTDAEWQALRTICQ